jgi:3'(2'), 5'-bisphosphate nucleotidase
LSDDPQRAAAELATAAGKLLVELRRSDLVASGLGAEGDRVANRFLVDELRRRFPADAILSEEERDDRRRLYAPRVWIIDPLDGTREYAEPGRDDWAVHVARWEAGRIDVAAVALPARGVTWSTADPPPPPPRRAGRLRMAVSRSRPPAVAGRLAEALDADLVAIGSAGAKTMAVVDGTVDAYVHAGGQREWDSAAPVGVALAAGLHASRLGGEPLVYNQPDPDVPDLLVCRSELAPRILAAVPARPLA